MVSFDHIPRYPVREYWQIQDVANAVQTKTGFASSWVIRHANITALAGTEVIRVRMSGEGPVNIRVTKTGIHGAASTVYNVVHEIQAYMDGGGTTASGVTTTIVRQIGTNAADLDASAAAEGANFGLDITLTNNHATSSVTLGVARLDITSFLDVLSVSLP